MNIRMIAGAVSLGLGLVATGCAKTTDAPVAPPETASDTPKDSAVTNLTPASAGTLSNAAVFECEGGGELQVQFSYGGAPSVLVSFRNGPAITLPAKEDATEQMFTDGTRSLVVEMDSVTWNDGSGEIACRGVSRPLPPPAAPNVVRDLTEADAGATVTLKVGERFSISLPDVPTAGYAWSPEVTPAFLKAGETLGGATSTAQFLPGFAGGSHWIVLVFEATAAGSAKLELAQRRPWEEKADPDDKRYSVSVKVQ